MAAITPLAPDLLVVGGTGFLGRHLVAGGVARAAPAPAGDTSPAWAVHATHHRTPPTTGAKIGWHACDLADGGAAMATLINDLRPSAVINAAYVQNGADLAAVTATAPGAMASACREVGARFVHISTDVVFDGTTDRPYLESDEPSPAHDYGKAKAESEHLVAAADPEAVIVRTSLLWGDRADPGPQVLMTRDPAIVFFSDEYRNPIAVSVLAAACLELAAAPHISGLLHVAGADTVNRHEFASRVCALADVDPQSLRSAASPPESVRVRNCPLDTTRARSVLRTRLPGVREVAQSQEREPEQGWHR